MTLILRRALASIINIILAFFVLLFICYSAGCFLWFFPLWSYLDLTYFYPIFGVTYATLGSLGLFTIPPIGSRLAGTSLRGRATGIKRIFQLILRNTLYISLPTFLVYAIPQAPSLVDLENRGIFFLAITLGLSVMFFSLLIIPISIIISGGQQGLHDKISGLTLCKRSSSEAQEYPTKKLIYRSALLSSSLSVLLTLFFHATIFGFKYDDILFPGEGRKSFTDAMKDLSKELDTTFKASDFKKRYTHVLDGFIWWVDLYDDINERLKASEAAGLKGLNQHDLLGYGVRIYDTYIPVNLINMSRDKTRLIPEGSRIFSVIIFTDNGIFLQKELQQLVVHYFFDKSLELSSAKSSDAIKIKVVRFVKAGFVKLGFFDEFYFTPDGSMWRSEAMLDLPIIEDLELGNQFKPGYITGNDLLN
jgi:hypothetical protein